MNNRVKNTILVVSFVLNVVMAGDLYFSASRYELEKSNARLSKLNEVVLNENGRLNSDNLDLRFRLNSCQTLVRKTSESND